MIDDVQGPESCNTYNMLRLTEKLFLSNPKTAYIDYYERAVFNHILSTQRPTGGFVYFTPMRPQHYRVYSQPQECFWCCVGTGLENHGKYGELIYAHTDKDLFVNLFIASKLDWKKKGIILRKNEVEYLEPVYLNDVVEIEVRPETIGNTSFSLKYFLRVGDKIKCKGESILVCFNFEEKVSVPVYPEFKKVFERYIK